MGAQGKAQCAMQLISCHNGRLLRSALLDHDANLARPRTFPTGLSALDELLPHGGFVRGAVHELLTHPRHGLARSVALTIARSAASETGAIVWCDPEREL